MGPIAHSLAALLAVGIAPFVASAMLLRPALRPGWRERAGHVPDRDAGRIWVHASSVGEAKAAARLIRSLESAGHRVRASTSTLGGRASLRRDLPDTPSSLAPLDHPWCVETAIRRTHPSLSVLIETELWPFWIAAADRHRIPVVVVSGRLSDRSFPRYRRVRRLMGPTLSRIDAVGARTDLDAERFVELGVPPERVRITGDLKLDPPVHHPALSIDLVRALAETPVVVGGSTHFGEEAALVRAMEVVEKAGHELVMVLAPRHVERVGELETWLRRRGRRVMRRSALEGRHLMPGEVLLLDTLGELPALYATAAIAFVGGTLVPVGGHNLVEPVHAGCPVLFGPRYENVRKVVEILERGGAGRCVPDEQALAAELVTALSDLDACRARGAVGRENLEAHRGSVERTRALIEGVLGRRGLLASGPEVALGTGREGA